MKQFLTLLLLLVIAAVPAGRAQTQASPAPDGAVLQTLIAVQLIESLDSPLAMVRSQTLKNAIVFSTIHRDQVDLSGAVSKIAKVAKSDDSDQNRRLALAALRAIGSYRANKYLAELQGIHEAEYRTLVASVISEYYENHSAGAL